MIKALSIFIFKEFITKLKPNEALPTFNSVSKKKKKKALKVSYILRKGFTSTINPKSFHVLWEKDLALLSFRSGLHKNSSLKILLKKLSSNILIDL